MNKIKRYIVEHIEFYYMRKVYVLGIQFFPRLKGYFGLRAEIRLGFGLFAVGVLFGKKKRGTL